MRISALLAGSALLFALSNAGAATDISDAAIDQAAQIGSHVSAQRALALKEAPIHSQQQLSQFIASGDLAKSPLALLSRPAQKRFIASLQFNEKGLTSFYYADIESELSVAQAYDVLQLLGAQHTVQMMKNLRVDSDRDREVRSVYGGDNHVVDDHMSYWCSGRATCSTNAGSICMSSC